jgi:tripartite-type tricarboxylate transporter receptor subunit TctC
MTRILFAALFALLFMTVAPDGVRADVTSAYKGKTLTVYSPFSARGGYGALTRVVAEHLPRYLPGKPRSVAKYMPGAGGIKQANFLYNIASKDGLSIGLMYDGIPTVQILRPERGVKYDVRKFNVLGSVNKGLFGVVAVLKTTGIKTLADAKKVVAITGSTGTGSAQHYVPGLMNTMLGTRFKRIPGYKSTSEMLLAMERGELTGIFTNYDTIMKYRAHWVKEGRFVFLAQSGYQRSTIFPKLPLLSELATKPDDKAVFKLLAQSRIPGKGLIAPPGVPADRVAALRKAFAATMKDPDFKKTIKKIKKKVDPRSWQAATALINGTLDASPAVIALVRKYVKPRKRKKKKKKKQK